MKELKKQQYGDKRLCFSEALFALRSGLTVSRDSYKDLFLFKLKDNEIKIITLYYKDLKGKPMEFIWEEIEQEDILAEDWFVVWEDKSYNTWFYDFG